jgi:Fe-S cluster assembly scaffold protein SufB
MQKKEHKIINYAQLSDLPEIIDDTKDYRSAHYFTHTKGSVKKHVDIFLNKPGSFIQLSGAVIGKKTDYFDLQVNVYHKAKKTTARVHIKTFLQDSCSFNFNGGIYISKNSPKVDSYLQQDNLVSSNKVICNTSPQLEISSNDVKASHGATVGTFDKDQLFYLQSKGLNRKDSKRLIAQGFLFEVLPKNSNFAF